MSSTRNVEHLLAEARYYKDRVALLRAKLYRWGVGSNARLKELEGELERAEQPPERRALTLGRRGQAVTLGSSHPGRFACIGRKNP